MTVDVISLIVKRMDYRPDCKIGTIMSLGTIIIGKKLFLRCKLFEKIFPISKHFVCKNRRIATVGKRISISKRKTDWGGNNP